MKLRYVVACPKHGVESKDWAGRMVVVPRPENKKEHREGGCPHCKQDVNKELTK
jgi:hypothetical protein